MIISLSSYQILHTTELKTYSNTIAEGPAAIYTKLSKDDVEGVPGT
jgi:hypothetical protein